MKIIINVNKALTDILQEMRGRMKKIDSNLVKVKKNLEYLEEMYEGIFRKVNRLLVAWLMFEINYTYYLMQNIYSMHLTITAKQKLKQLKPMFYIR